MSCRELPRIELFHGHALAEVREGGFPEQRVHERPANPGIGRGNGLGQEPDRLVQRTRRVDGIGDPEEPRQVPEVPRKKQVSSVEENHVTLPDGVENLRASDSGQPGHERQIERESLEMRRCLLERSLRMAVIVQGKRQKSKIRIVALQSLPGAMKIRMILSETRKARYAELAD